MCFLAFHKILSRERENNHSILSCRVYENRVNFPFDSELPYLVNQTLSDKNGSVLKKSTRKEFCTLGLSLVGIHIWKIHVCNTLEHILLPVFVWVKLTMTDLTKSCDEKTFFHNYLILLIE